MSDVDEETCLGTYGPLSTKKCETLGLQSKLFGIYILSVNKCLWKVTSLQFRIGYIVRSGYGNKTTDKTRPEEYKEHG